MTVQILFVLLFLVINVQAKTYYINDVCRFQTSSSLICEWVNEGNYTEREPNINYRHVEHIEFNRLQNSVVDLYPFKKLTTISFPMSQFDVLNTCDHIKRQTHAITLYMDTISVTCDVVPSSTDYVYTQEETSVATPPSGKESITNHTIVTTPPPAKEPITNHTAHETPITTQTKVLYHTHVLSNSTLHSHLHPTLHISSSTQSVEPSSFNSTLMNAVIGTSITAVTSVIIIVIMVIFHRFKIIKIKRIRLTDLNIELGSVSPTTTETSLCRSISEPSIMPSTPASSPDATSPPHMLPDTLSPDKIKETPRYNLRSSSSKKTVSFTKAM